MILALPKAIHAPNQTDDSLTGRPNFKSKWAFFNENRDIVASSLASCLVVIAIVVWMEKIQDNEPEPAEAAKEPTSHVIAQSE